MRYTLAVMVICLISLLSVGCEVLPEVEPVPTSSFGMVPTYVDSASAKTISTTGPTAIIDGRAFAILGDTIFIVDQLRGVHIVDNTDAQNPSNISFISIPGCTSVAVNGNFLYVNNLLDLVTLDITDRLNAIVVDREEDLYPSPLDFPEGYTGYYACYDPAFGYLTGWELASLTEPQCYIE